ncbi:DUF3238 domain-containing protein [Spongiactinospora sp. 9N601]|uniref:DUF3238 domain-containing protein n=1 Tax=Spongiactinospora sp. 9N601 TaxID=3375149 RepID=UPI0037BCB9F7
MKRTGRTLAVATGLTLAITLTPGQAPATTKPAAPTTAFLSTTRPAAGSARLAKRTWFTYRTFIRDKFAPGFPCTMGGRKFGGDNRNFSSKTASFRTRMQIRVDWTRREYELLRQVMPTRIYNKRGKYLGSETASTKNMKFVDLKVSTTKASFEIKHWAQNPYCNVGGIKYNLKVTLYRDGRFSVSGARRKAPHHEAYLRHDYFTNPALFVILKWNKGFHCLAAFPCRKEKLKASGRWRP